jgi:very-short-patch-repair endonuclease
MLNLILNQIFTFTHYSKVTFIKVILLALWMTPGSSHALNCKPLLEQKLTHNHNQTFLGLRLPKIEVDQSGDKYYLFHDFDEAVAFMTESRELSIHSPEMRLKHMRPLLLGLARLTSDTKKIREMSRYEKMHFVSALTTWILTYRQVDFAPDSLSNIYPLISKIVTSQAYQIDQFITYMNISQTFSGVFSAPPEKLARRWIELFPVMVKNAARYKYLVSLLDLVPYLRLTDLERVQLANSWLKAESGLPRDSRLRALAFALSKLYKLHPPSAYKYYRRHKKEFETLDLHRPAMIIRPLLYFKHVFKHEVPNFDHGILWRSFSKNDEHSSRLELTVRSWLRDYGFDFKVNELDPSANAIEMDLVVYLPNGKVINIEADGKHHERLDQFGDLFKRMADVRRDEILNAMGIQVYRLSHRDILENPETSSQRLIEYLINEL